MTGPISERLMVQIHPSSQLRGDYDRWDRADGRADAHDRYQRRLEAGRFNLPYFNDLESRLRGCLRAWPDDSRLRYELAMVLLQGRVTTARLAEVRVLHGLLSPDEPRTARLGQLLEMMTGNAAQDIRGMGVRRVNWSINNTCPMLCKGCYNPFTEGQVDLDRATLILEKLVGHGVEALMISGGDPLLWPPLDAFLARVRRHGLAVGLDTTGYGLTPERAAALAPFVDSFGLPLDGSTNKIQRTFRHSPDRDLVGALRSALAACDAAGVRHVRVHTVINKGNLDDIGGIAAIIGSYACVRQWTLFQWWGRRAAGRIERDMAVSPAQFRRAVAAAKAAADPIEVVGYDVRRREMTNFFLQSSGQVVTFGAEREEEFIVGDLLVDEVDDILASPAIRVDALVPRLVGHGYDDQPDSPSAAAASRSATT